MLTFPEHFKKPSNVVTVEMKIGLHTGDRVINRIHCDCDDLDVINEGW